ncbi:metallophosphatase [Colwellia sp. 75C3]|uniref:alkaline phosphatase D family protein n=1 Tax=Colwellia sp. 75C3 TaxID=888425 RepID=UPI000C34231C|nr:alkaline phosphatase D family protein [Colwellia sp. 75C3]PKG80795.1 metallophosphatase [Colwellia sp. 75C3]
MKHFLTTLIITATLTFAITTQATPLSQLDITPQKILFGSCSHQDKDMPILKAINNENADLFVFLGDNIYGDTENMQEMADKYQRLGNNTDIKTLRLATPTIAIWDDHDFGENDAGAEYAQKEQSRKLMLDFWQEPKDSPRYTQKHGIYTAYMTGKSDNSVHVILPDLRWNRDTLTTVGKYDYQTKRKVKNMGPYSPNLAKNASMLGETQWQWLETELQKPSKIKIIASSLQLLPEFTGWESWANFPHDRERLFALIKKHQVNGVIIISGDTHWGEMSKVTTDLDYPLWEVTSSGLTEEWKEVSPNIHRVGNFISKVNYGELLIDWQQIDPKITLSLKEVDGKVFNRQVISLSSISPYDKG